jgi:hypothetical protein
MNKRYLSVRDMVVDMKNPKILEEFDKLVAEDEEFLKVVTDDNGIVRLLDTRTNNYL